MPFSCSREWGVAVRVGSDGLWSSAVGCGGRQRWVVVISGAWLRVDSGGLWSSAVGCGHQRGVAVRVDSGVLWSSAGRGCAC